MTTVDAKRSVLETCVGRPQTLGELVAYATDSVVSKTILDSRPGTLTLFAFDRGQKLSEHTSPYDAVVQVIEGAARLTIDGQDVVVSAGRIVVMPANVPHAVAADERFKMLLTMIRG